MFCPVRGQGSQHHRDEDDAGDAGAGEAALCRARGEGLVSGAGGFITGGPIVAAVVEGLEAIRVVREMLGPTSGLKAAPGTIRGDFSSSRQMNLVHGSDGPEAAAREIALYFRPEEIVPFEPTLRPWLRATDE